MIIKVKLYLDKHYGLKPSLSATEDSVLCTLKVELNLTEQNF